ncbi:MULTISPECIES: MarR family winged helix-turn-helix transcriptional regulator [unclassified Oceanobacter]|uniref:MarR family winged helix-turn-helix transcriptional regulator n=1 Tax=unclassified Oceanobacter TaxID=2620260 RepID=UPI002733110E|nr:MULTISPECIES: MarR family transcriptional regulator [unclassified Oceanobacter]MDP2610204.1 MarR family transcriptional regulator [Oceanobacter sp. 1_MG-2023]MDP2613470.1 MarR family transcriptional regulator [Oceanobacter sp. 2_MG-2023]
MTKPTRSPRSQRYNPASEDFHKEDFPFYWIAQVHGRYVLAMEKALKKIKLDIPRWRILFILKEEGTSSISEIAIHAVAKLPTVTKTVYRMKDDGLVDTRQKCDDGRVTEVTITEEGRQAIENIQLVTHDLFRESFKGMSEAQIQRLNKLLETLFHNLPEH